VADPDETSRQHVKQESLDEVRGLEGEPLRGAALSISIAKCHLIVLEGEEPFVADGNAMGVAAQVAQHLCGTSQRRLAIDHPLPRRRLAQQAGSKRQAESASPLVECPLEAVEELGFEDPGEHPHGHEESRPRSDPAIPGGGEPAACHDAVQVGMEGEGLGPGVQDCDRAGQGTEATAAHVMQRLEGGVEEHRIAAPAVGEEEGMQRLGHGEDQMEVLHRQEAALLGLDPPSLLEVLALGAMAVATGVVQGDFASAVVAHKQVATQKRRSARDDVVDHPTALKPKPLQRRGVCLEDLCELRRAAPWGRQGLSRRDLVQGIEGGACLAQVITRHVRVALGRGEAAMTEQNLDRAHIHA